MDELESRLEHELSSLGRVPLAEPEPVERLRRRARRVRAARALTSVVAVATAVVVVGAVVVAVNNNSPTAHHQKLQLSVSAPGFVLGDIDAVVLSSSFDGDGARNALPPALTATVAHVPGVQSVSGVIDTFAPIVSENPDGSLSYDPSAGGPAPPPRVPPRTPILFSYHKDDEVHIVEGRVPAAADEIVVDTDFVTRSHTKVGEKVSLQVKGQAHDFHIVGTFDLPGVDLTGIPLAALSAAHQPPEIALDRIDVNLAAGAVSANVRDAIAVAVGNAYTVLQPSAISFADQRLAQVEIQHAYWALLSPDQNERSTSGVGPPSAKESANYAKYSELALSVELRVENVNFLSPDAASLTYRIYYSGSPSPVINDPQTGTATRVKGHWQLGTNTLCSLAALVGISCKGTDNVTITPPNGYEALTSLNPEVVTAFGALTNPNATVDQRVAAIANGDMLRTIIEAGVNTDRADGESQFTIAGWRADSATKVEILYSLTTTKGPSTPWPSTATAEKAADGHWYASQRYACGIAGLAAGACISGPESPGPPGVPSVTATPLTITGGTVTIPGGTPTIPGSTPTTATASAASP